MVLICLSLLQGVLTEAALCLEAAVQRDPSSVEAWRLLGTVHAENDDDKHLWYIVCPSAERAGTNAKNLTSLFCTPFFWQHFNL